MAIVIRHNGRLNNAFSGAAQGIQSGLALGLNLRASKRADAAQQAQLELARNSDARAQAREGRDAEFDATRLDAFKADVSRAQQLFEQQRADRSADQAAFGYAASQDPLLSKAAYAQEIAKRVSPQNAPAFLTMVKGNLKRQAMEEERGKLVEELGQRIASGDFHMRQPDGSKVESAAVMNALMRVQEYLAREDSDPTQARAQLNAISAQLVDDETEFESRQNKVAFYRQEVSNLASSGVEAGAALKLLNAYERGLISQREMEENWMDASQGLVRIDDGKGNKLRVPYDQRQNFEAMVQERFAMEGELAQLKAELARSQITTEGAQARKYEAEAGAAQDLGTYRRAAAASEGQARPEAPLSYADARKMAASELPTGEAAQIEARTQEIMRAAGGQSRSSGAPVGLTPEQQTQMQTELREAGKAISDPQARKAKAIEIMRRYGLEPGG